MQSFGGMVLTGGSRSGGMVLTGGSRSVGMVLTGGSRSVGSRGVPLEIFVFACPWRHQTVLYQQVHFAARC